MKGLLYFILLFCLAPQFLQAQTELDAKRKLELQFAYSLQRPYYSISSIQDVFLPKQYRFRSGFAAGARYYVFSKWFVEGSTAYSQQGGGFKQQHTNANYWANSLRLGFSSKHSRKLIFELYGGIDFNVLLTARFKNKVSHHNENVRAYLKPTFVSFPLGLGFKKRVLDNTYVSLGTFMSFSGYRVSALENTRLAQFMLPSFRIGVSRFIP